MQNVVIIDIDSSGILESLDTFMRDIRKNIYISYIPVITLTYKKDVNKIIAAISSGVDNFILKPFESDMFIERVQELLKEAELIKQSRKVIDLEYVNYLMHIGREFNQEEYLRFSETVFNKLVLDIISLG